MKKTEKQELAKALKLALQATSQKWDDEGPGSASYCYGYLIGVIHQAIVELEN